MASLQSKLHDLASSFAVEELQAVRNASLQDLQSAASGSARNGRAAVPAARSRSPRSSGRLARRSTEDIASSNASWAS